MSSLNCSTNNGSRTVTLRLPSDLYSHLEKVCLELDLNRGEVIRELLYHSVPDLCLFLDHQSFHHTYSKKNNLELLTPESLVVLRSEVLPYS